MPPQPTSQVRGAGSDEELELLCLDSGMLLPEKIVDCGSPVMANRVCALITQMFGVGVERGMLEAIPFISLPHPGGYREIPQPKAP